MLMDFCQRCAAAKLPKGVSAASYRCMTFIQSHTNASIGLEDVAGEIGRSSSYVMRRFKAELGMSAGEYITKCKLEEACDLLIYGDRSLAEISAYLGYSSQSYFQNVFKKQFGMSIFPYIAHLRCKKAAQMLRESAASVQEISSYVGYEDSNYFVKVFKKQYEKTPSAYRAAFK